jgi:hypothetical protein
LEEYWNNLDITNDSDDSYWDRRSNIHRVSIVLDSLGGFWKADKDYYE